MSWILNCILSVLQYLRDKFTTDTVKLQVAIHYQ